MTPHTRTIFISSQLPLKSHFKPLSLVLKAIYIFPLPTTYPALTSSHQSLLWSLHLNQHGIFSPQVSILAPLLTYNAFPLPSCWCILTASFKIHSSYAPFQEAFLDSLTISLIFCAEQTLKPADQAHFTPSPSFRWENSRPKDIKLFV